MADYNSLDLGIIAKIVTNLWRIAPTIQPPTHGHMAAPKSKSQTKKKPSGVTRLVKRYSLKGVLQFRWESVLPAQS
jgi:hypothetical protein